MVSKLNYDDLLSHIGTFGGYQLRNFILLCVPIILCAFHKLSSVFILAKIDHRCQLNSNDTEFLLSNNQDVLYTILTASFPYDEKKGFSKCQYYLDNYFNRGVENTTHTAVACDEYVWDYEKFQSSAIKTFKLICDRDHFKATSDSVFMIGVFIGSFAFGHLSDKYGRRKVFVLSLIFQLIFGLLTALATNFYTFTIFRMIVGATTSGVFLVAYCLSLEMVGKESRMVAGVVFMMFFSSGYILMGFLAFIITDWRWYQIAITMPGFIFLTYWWFIPESTRWLLANNKKQKAVKQIKKIALSNNVELPKEMLDKLIETETENNTDENESKPSVFDLFKLPHLRTKAFLIFFNWFVVSGAYYGLSWSSGDLIGNPRFNHIISGFVELPGYVLLLLTLNRFGRKKVLAGNLTFAGIVLLLSLAVPQDITWLVITLTMLGKMSITASYGTIYLFSVEQFPTVIRNVALGCCSMSARVGSTISPYLLYLANTWQPLPILIFGLTAFIGGFFSLFLPETYNKDLPDTLADAEINDLKMIEVPIGEELKELNKNDNKNPTSDA
ncbi:hypothetical protein PVAND_002337 [Polypedilum vanderplanki]|uniref:Major facilitator superfamily (MFS) profile domain-containing protein n=1 Tax=Polypedilum vanderplanki TaxID=319348 RepID=A0A9J6BRV5_POLVA|nr:hypothetical protein PVAND_002337 [Polypedilum vanderplanki]